MHSSLTYAGPTISNTSRESHAKQKALAQERKNAKPNADSIARSKKLWEQLRRKSHVERTERKKLVAELFEIITGRVVEFVYKHDAVRVIQTALKYANLDQRKMIGKELKGRYLELAKGRYSKFLIGKVLVHCDDEIRDLVVPEFYGQVRRLINHPEASWIMDDIYRGIATREQKNLLLREWYGAEFALFKKKAQNGDSTSDLKSLLDQHPEKRTPVMRSLFDLINQLIQKKTSGFTMLHDAMLQYYLNVQRDGSEASDFLELLKGDEEGDLLKNLAFTESGSRLVCLALAHGAAKDRKQILRVYKDLFQTLAYDNHGHQIILTAYDVVDDTVMLSKMIVSELTGSDKKANTDPSSDPQQTLLVACNNLNARTAILYPFAGRVKSILANSDLKILAEIAEIRKTTSKKDPEVRRKEVVAAFTPGLLNLIAVQAQELVSTSFGCQLAGEVLLVGVVSNSEERLPALTAISSLLDSSSATFTTSTNDTSSTVPLLESAAFGRLLKSLILGGKYDASVKKVHPSSPPLGFDDLFYDQVCHQNTSALVKWATGDNSFTVVGLLESEHFQRKEEVRSTLRKHQRALEDAAGEQPSSKPGKGKKKKGGKEAEGEGNTKKSNAGTWILLQQIA